MDLPPRVLDRIGISPAAKAQERAPAPHPQPDGAPAQPPKADVARSEGSPHVTAPASLRSSAIEFVSQRDDTRSLPVLAHFQEFLDVERKRSQRAVGALAAVFSVVVLTSIAVSVVVGKRQLDAVRGEALETRRVAAAAGIRLDEVAGQVNRETQRLESELATTGERLANTRSGIESLDARVATATGELEAIRNQLAALTVERDGKARDVAAALADLTNRIIMLAIENEALREELMGSRDTVRERSEPRGPTPGHSVSMAFTNGPDEISWRVPLPD